MKRLCVCLLAIAVFLGIAGTAGFFWSVKQNIGKGYTMELIVKGTDMDFWESVNEGAQAAAANYHVTVSLLGPATEKNYSEQVNIMENAIARKPDAIILAAADYSLLAQPVQDAIDEGIPVIMVDSDVDNSRTVAYVGTDNKKLGMELGKQMCRYVQKQTGEVGIISFVKESYPAVQREEGFRSAMQEDARFILLDTAYGYSEVTKAEALTTEMVASHPNLVAVASLNAWSSEGAARALSKLGRNEIQLFSIDCTPELAMYMEEGVLSLALLQNPYQMGYYGVETACRYLEGETVSNRFTDIYPVDRTTLFDDLYQQLIFPFNS